MNINFDPIKLPTVPSLDSSGGISTGERGESGSAFLSYLEKSMGEVNQLLNDADQKGSDLALGKTESLHESMIASEKAETAFKLMVQFRAKAMEAYNEIIKMQV